MDRGWAFFVLGYREFEAGHDSAAERDLARAAATGFPFADLATYFEARAAYRNSDPGKTAEILEPFAEKFPVSTAREDAAELLAWAYLQTAKPADAIRTLTEIPEVNRKAKLALLLARAYQEADRPLDAAMTYQNVYYAFPDSSQSRAAKGALDTLKAQLGARFPRVSDQIATARVERLLREGNYRQALDELGEMLKQRRGSSLAWQWNLDRGRCLMRLGKADQTIETLAGAPAASPGFNAERLEILTRAYVQEKDEASAERVLKELEASYPASPHLARALWVMADYLMWKPDLAAASHLYHHLAQSFPRTPEGSEASWEAAWTEYLAGKRDAAEEDFLAFIRSHPSSPRVPGAIYFLGRIAKQQGKSADARADFELVRGRFVHDYYAVKAERQLRNLSEHRAGYGPRNDPEAGGAAREIARLIPDQGPIPVSPCGPVPEDRLLEPYFDLHLLGFDGLAREAAWAFTAQRERSPDFLVTLGRLDSETGRPDVAIQRVKKVSPLYDWYPFSALPRGMWDLLYPRHYWALVRRRAAAYRLDPYLVMALIRQESGFYPKAESYANARGLMQILPETASPRPSPWIVRRLSDPSFNIHLGCEYLRQLLRKYAGNLAEALAAYNAGPHNVDDWVGKYPPRTQGEFIETIPYPATRVYVKAVLRDAAMYRMMLTGAARYRTCRAASGHSERNLKRRIIRH